MKSICFKICRNVIRILIVGIAAFSPSAGHGHLCNDVFAQARDNLVVKVDIRDGQLRIGKEASFKVYLLNTMDRDIAEIALDIESEEFEAEVAPSPAWRLYPALPTARENPAWRAHGREQGKKEYFTVTLRRKPNIPDGAYKIGLNLVSRRQNLVFRAIDLDTAADMVSVPRIRNIEVDGRATRDEWGGGFLCANFSTGRRAGRYTENIPATAATRVRLAHDGTHLYFLAMFHGGDTATSDTLTIHLAPTADDAPKTLTLDRTAGVLAGSDGQALDATAVVNTDENLVEGRIPLDRLGVTGQDVILINFSRTLRRDGRIVEQSYWRGNEMTITQPIAYAQIVFTP